MGEFDFVTLPTKNGIAHRGDPREAEPNRCDDGCVAGAASGKSPPHWMLDDHMALELAGNEWLSDAPGTANRWPQGGRGTSAFRRHRRVIVSGSCCGAYG